MTKVAIHPVEAQNGEISFHAVAGIRRSSGRTAGEALDALAAQLPEDEAGTLVVVQSSRPDRFFTAARQARLSELMQLWRDARNRGEALPAEQLAELEALTEAELRAAGTRAGRLADELGR